MRRAPAPGCRGDPAAARADRPPRRGLSRGSGSGRSGRSPGTRSSAPAHRSSSPEHRGVAPRVVHRRLAGLRFRVAPGHDHDAVVVARVVHGRLDRVVLAVLGERRVDPAHPAAPSSCTRDLGWLGRRRKPCAGRASIEASAASDRPVLALAHDEDVAGALARNRRLQRARRRDRAAGRRADRRVSRRVGPVRRALEVGRGERRQAYVTAVTVVVAEMRLHERRFLVPLASTATCLPFRLRARRRLRSSATLTRRARLENTLPVRA